MIARVMAGCVVSCALAFALLAEEPKEAQETKLKPTAVYSGSHSQIRHERFEVVSTEQEWKKLWDRHRGGYKDRRFTEESAELAIDFDEHYVVAVFTGSCDWCKVTPRQRGDTVLIGYQPRIWSIKGGLPQMTKEEQAKKDALAPYAFVVLPKPVRTVVIEENVQLQHSEPPIWKVQKRFRAPKDNK